MKKAFLDISLEEEILMDVEHSHHILNVLRHKKERPLPIANSTEGMAMYRFQSMNDDGTSLWHREGAIVPVEEKGPIVLVQAFLKGDKFEWVLQKTTELDVTEIITVPSAHTVVQYDGKKLEAKDKRWQKILMEASQQCNRGIMPTCTHLSSWASMIEYCRDKYKDALLLVAYENEEQRHIKSELREHYGCEATKEKAIIICIGPEGGLAEAEVQALEKEGAKRVTLGETILRAETAAVASVAMIAYERE